MKKLFISILAFLGILVSNAQTKPAVSKKIPDSVYNRTDLAFGGSFDFNNGLNATQFYYGLKMNWPDVFKRYNQNNKGIKSFGASFGIYQTQLFGYSDSVNVGQTNRLPTNIRTNYFSIKGDSVRILRAQLNGYSINQSISTIGGFFNPTFTLLGKKEASLSGLVNLEYARRTITTTKKSNFIPLDTITVSNSVFSNYNPVDTAESFSKNYNEFYFGVGLALRIIKNDIDFNLDAIWGKGDYSTIGWQSYYATDLNIKFIKYNLELGANYKGLFQTHGPLPPYYFSLHIAKLFSFDKLMDFIAK